MIEKVENFKRQQIFQINKESISFANKCLNCSVFSYCNHKTGSFETISLPYKTEELKFDPYEFMLEKYSEYANDLLEREKKWDEKFSEEEVPLEWSAINESMLSPDQFVNKFKQKHPIIRFLRVNDNLQTAKVLIVDDEVSIQKKHAGTIASLGYDFDVACDGLECLEKLKAAKFDLVLMNIKMPKMDGVETLDEIVKTYPTIPVIMVSAMVIDSTVTMLKEHGAFAVFKKPVECKALVRAIQEALKVELTSL